VKEKEVVNIFSVLDFNVINRAALDAADRSSTAGAWLQSDQADAWARRSALNWTRTWIYKTSQQDAI